ncbi:MAG: hypothetical protein JW768_11510 [Chitinispirillaceae bacterium]|nr:hypothetical protein [Chitinispirillaceae bacterium]
MDTKIITLITGLLVFASGSHGTVDTNARVDTMLFFTADFTADGIRDSVCCHITGRSWKSPFSVTYTVKSSDAVIFNKTFDDGQFDEDFGNREALGWCAGSYLKCKEKWYLGILGKKLVASMPLNSRKRKALFDTSSEASLYRTMTAFYADSLGYSGKKASAEAKKTVAPFEKRAFSFLMLPLHPLYASFPLVYEPRSGKFITHLGY